MFLISEVLQSGRVRIRYSRSGTQSTCHRCGSTEWVLHRRPFTSGMEHITVLCKCGRRGPLISKSVVTKAGFDIQSLGSTPKPPWRGNVCSECWADEVEWHHVAPRALFGGEAEMWPIVPLCIKHHAEWHRVMTPGLRSGCHRPVCDLSSEIMDRIRAAKRARAGETVCNLCASRTWSFFDYAPIHLLKHWKNGITGHLCNRCAARWEAHFPVLAQRR